MTNLSDISNALADAVNAASASIVTVLTPRPVSGTVVGPDSVLTVAHVLRGDDATVRTADGRELAATVAGRDPASDLALLKVEGLNLPALSAAGDLRLGELVLALGQTPHGPQATLGLHGAAAQRGPLRGWLGAGAEPFRGASGGALLDARGDMVGLLNAGVMRGTLLAVPAARALKVADELGTLGRVKRGYLGVATQPVRFPGERPADPEPQGDEAAQATEQDRQDADRRDDGRGQERGRGFDREDFARDGRRGGFGPRGVDPRDFGRGDFGRGDPRAAWFERRGWDGRGWDGRGQGEGRGRGERDGGRGDGRGAWSREGWGRGPWSHGPWARGGETRGWARDGWARGGWDKGGKERWGRGPRQGGKMGLTIVQIEAGSPAEAAGLKVGDILLSLNGAALRHPQELLGWVRDHAGQTVQAQVLRSGEEQTVQITLGER